jgi:hypothetical protein
MLAFEGRLGHRYEGKLASTGLMGEWFLVRIFAGKRPPIMPMRRHEPADNDEASYSLSRAARFLREGAAASGTA